jgi:hypothetical protein
MNAQPPLHLAIAVESPACASSSPADQMDPSAATHAQGMRKINQSTLDRIKLESSFTKTRRSDISSPMTPNCTSLIMRLPDPSIPPCDTRHRLLDAAVASLCREQPPRWALTGFNRRRPSSSTHDQYGFTVNGVDHRPLAAVLTSTGGGRWNRAVRFVFLMRAFLDSPRCVERMPNVQRLPVHAVAQWNRLG